MMTDLISRIDAALDGTTETRPSFEISCENYTHGENVYEVIGTDRDIKLFAAAPSLLREARDEITRLQGELTRINRIWKAGW